MVNDLYLKLRSVTITFCLSCTIFITLGQAVENKVPYYNIDQKRLLLMSTGNFIFGISQGQFEIDSAYLFACKMYGLSRLLAYNEEYSDGIPTTGSLLIDAGHIDSAKKHLTSLTDIDRIKLLLDLGVFYTFKAGANSYDLDSAYYFLEQADVLTEKLPDKELNMAVRELLGRMFFQMGKQEKSQKYFESVVDHYAPLGDTKELARALEMKAIHLSFRDSSRLKLLQESLLIYEKLNYVEKQIEVLTHIVTIKFFTNWQTATVDLERILELQRKSGFKHVQYTLNVLAYLCEARAEYIKGQMLSQEVLEVINDLGDLELASVFYLRSASFFLRFDKRSQAVQLFERILKQKLDPNTQIFWYPCLMVMTESLINSGQSERALHLIDSITAIVPPYYLRDKISMSIERAQAYAKLHMNEQAEKHFSLWRSYVETAPIQFQHAEIPHSWVSMAVYYFSIGDLVKSKLCLDKAFGFKNKFAVATSANYFRLKSSLDSADGNYLAAMEYYKLYKLFDDSSRNLRHIGLLDQLQIQFQTKEKDKDIQLLQSGIRQGIYQRNMILTGTAFLLITAILLFWQFRAKQKSNAILELQKKEINDKNTILTSLLQEKEWLLKEVHHRVKNNLQTVVSLLESQSYFLEKDALYAIQDCQNRVYSMSLIHQRLYQSENVESINLSSYIADLVGYLTKIFNVGNRIQFILSIQSIKLDVSQAIPVGLILNEAITNSIKYAFPSDRIFCQMIIELQENENDLITLSIRDNGIGLPKDVEVLKRGSLGLKLIKGLAEDLQGSCSIGSADGAFIVISFVRHHLLDLNSESNSFGYDNNSLKVSLSK